MSLIYIHGNTFLKKTEDVIEPLEKLKVEKNDIITSVLSIKDIITYTFKIPLSTSDSQLDAECDIQFYENAGLDLNKQYKHFYIKKELENEEVYLIEAIAIEEEILKTRFQTVIEKTNYIDYISLSIFTFNEFYELYNKEAKRDAFVYLDHYQSFIAIYENGEYVYSKTLNPLNTLLKDINLEYKEFIKVMETKGVNKENYDLDDYLIANEVDKFFSEYFMAINNRISYGKNIFYLENVDNIYFYTPFNIKDIDTLKEFWELSGINFEIIKHEHINLLDNLAIHYNEKHYKDEVNFSIFPRPPKFYKTKVFQLAMVILVTFLIFGGDFGYRYYQNQQLQKNINKIQHLVNLKKSKLNKLEAINRIVMKKMNIYTNEISTINKHIAHIKKILQTSLVLTNSPKVNNDMILITKLLKKNKLATFFIQKDEKNTFEIGVYTYPKNRKSIAKFMNDLSTKGYKNIQTDNISNTNEEFYLSLIRFDR